MDPLWWLLMSAVGGLVTGATIYSVIGGYWTAFVLVGLFLTARLVSYTSFQIMEAVAWVSFWTFVAGLCLASAYDISVYVTQNLSA